MHFAGSGVADRLVRSSHALPVGSSVSSKKTNEDPQFSMKVSRPRSGFTPADIQADFSEIYWTDRDVQAVAVSNIRFYVSQVESGKLDHNLAV